MKHASDLTILHNVEIDLFERGKRKRWHYSSKNIITDVGRQFMIENITAQSFSPGSFVRHQNTVVRYIGFGIGGDRQGDPLAAASPLADAHPAGYGGTNAQDDETRAVTGLERPVLADGSNYLREISAPGTFPSATSGEFVATFAEDDLNLGVHSIMPISEIALYKSDADPTLPNGSGGGYPGAGGYAIAYDTFNSIPKSGLFTIEVRWQWRLG